MTLSFCRCGGEVASGGAAPAGGAECLACGEVYASTEALQFAGGFSGLICSRVSSKAAAMCDEPGCTGPHVALCDEPIGGRRTCDAKVCAQHRVPVGRNRDRCPAHANTITLGGR